MRAQDLKELYEKGRYDKKDLKEAVIRGWITFLEFCDILGIEEQTKDE